MQMCCQVSPHTESPHGLKRRDGHEGFYKLMLGQGTDLNILLALSGEHLKSLSLPCKDACIIYNHNCFQSFIKLSSNTYFCDILQS